MQLDYMLNVLILAETMIFSKNRVFFVSKPDQNRRQPQAYLAKIVCFANLEFFKNICSHCCQQAHAEAPACPSCPAN